MLVRLEPAASQLPLSHCPPDPTPGLEIEVGLLPYKTNALTTEPKSQLFGSVVRALVLYRGGSGLIPYHGVEYF